MTVRQCIARVAGKTIPASLVECFALRIHQEALSSALIIGLLAICTVVVDVMNIAVWIWFCCSRQAPTFEHDIRTYTCNTGSCYRVVSCTFACNLYTGEVETIQDVFILANGTRVEIWD